MAAVLRIMVTAVGDEPIIPCHFHPSDPRFSDLLQTTFDELKHFDERGGINDPAPDTSWEIGATVYIDVDLAYQLNDNWRINLGAVNIADEFVDMIPNDGIHANRISAGLPFPRRSAANYEGGQWYLRGTFSFE